MSENGPVKNTGAEAVVDHMGQDEQNRLKKKPVRKLVGGLILLAALCVFYMAYLLLFDLNVDTKLNMGTRGFEIKALSRSLEKAISLMDFVSEDNIRRHMEKVALEADACAGQIRGRTDFEPCMYQDGAIIRVSDGSVIYPAGFPENYKIGKEQITEGTGVVYLPGNGLEEEKNTVCYACIDGPLYYVEWESYDERAQKQNGLFDSGKVIEGMEKAFDVNLLLFPVKAREDGQHTLYFISEAVEKPEYLSAEDYGITQEMISGAERDVPGIEETDTSGIQLVGTREGNQDWPLEIDGRMYEAYFLKYDSPAVGETSILACLVPVEGSKKIYSEVARVVVAVFFIIGMFFLVWYCATLRQVRDWSLSENEKRELCFASITRRSCSILAIGCVIILAVSAMMLALVAAAWRTAF